MMIDVVVGKNYRSKISVVLINTIVLIFICFFVLIISRNLSRGEFGDSLGAFRYGVLG